MNIKNFKLQIWRDKTKLNFYNKQKQTNNYKFNQFNNDRIFSN